MPVNLEIKARVTDLNSAKNTSLEIGAKYSGLLIQTDTYFNTKIGRLKLREIAGRGAELIYYNRDEATEKRISDFSIYHTQDPNLLKELISHSWGIRGVIQKQRYLYMLNNTRIHLDDVKILGYFMELEIPVLGERNEAQNLLNFLLEKFNITESQMIRESYIDLFLNQLS
jgi:predicted adenylyl cyclase CyaB